MAAKKRRTLKREKLSRKIRFYLYVFLPILISILFLQGNSGIINQVRLSQKSRHLDYQLQMLQEQRTQLQKEVELLQTDIQYIEKIAREMYGFCKPDETVFMMRIEDDKK